MADRHAAPDADVVERNVGGTPLVDRGVARHRQAWRIGRNDKQAHATIAPGRHNQPVGPWSCDNHRLASGKDPVFSIAIRLRRDAGEIVPHLRFANRHGEDRFTGQRLSQNGLRTRAAPGEEGNGLKRRFGQRLKAKVAAPFLHHHHLLGAATAHSARLRRRDYSEQSQIVRKGAPHRGLVAGFRAGCRNTFPETIALPQKLPQRCLEQRLLIAEIKIHIAQSVPCAEADTRRRPASSRSRCALI
nr:hypothetical protein [Novosphingobium sp. UBA1939]